MPGHHQEQLLHLQMCGRSKRTENAFYETIKFGNSIPGGF